MALLNYLLIVPVCAFAYRWGGGGFKFLPDPFNCGFKPVRRYALPLFVGFMTQAYFYALVLCVILHYNLDEIEEKDWDDVSCYGLAQAWCFSYLGVASVSLAVWWFSGVIFSNIAVFKNKLNWFWVELGQGAIIGALTAYAIGRAI